MNEPSKTFQRHSEAALEAIRAGASIADAARQAGCGRRSVDRWLQAGRLDPRGPYGAFAAAADAARQEQGVPGASEAELMDEIELKRVAARAARNGSVAAMKLIHEMHIADPAETGPDRVDELQARRRQRRGMA